jgi:hypothetical protein
MPVKRKWISFCAVAASHLGPGYACSIETSACRKMTNGVNGTEKVGNEVIY